ncbi:hypothetical protein [Pseudomonas sp. LS-2]|uniref:hypothetical protein n=1 Tax=Pseudomonas sp. LS-2 TaxID=2315859 RepID=UPI000E715736|nr:hypothetical protein [Pseudomonas sp. LS-2]RJX80327.1 hypothetical protein D3M70_12320 [Pseudomonas sp. LS-2]
MFKFLKVCLAAIVLAVVSGCTTVETMSRGSDDGLRALSMVAPRGGAALYVYRDRASDFGLYQMKLTINGKDVVLAPACVTRIELTPGHYHLEAGHPDLFGGEQEVDMDATVGGVTVFEFKPVARFVISGESKLIPTTAPSLLQVIHSQRLCMQSTVRF